jgi:hypothetical protein
MVGGRGLLDVARHGQLANLQFMRAPENVFSAILCAAPERFSRMRLMDR